MTEHLPRHRLEALTMAAADRAHLSACTACAERLRAIEGARAAFLAHQPPADFTRAVLQRADIAQAGVHRIARTPSWRASAIGGGVVLAAAAALLLWLRPAPFADAILLKGGPSLSVYAKQGGRVEPLHDGDALSAGTQLGFVCSLPRSQYVLLLGIEDTGAISRYFAAPAKLAPGARVQLPVGIELDEHRGTERLFAFFSDAPLDEADVRRALAASYADARTRGLPLSMLARIDIPAEQVSVWYRKP